MPPGPREPKLVSFGQIPQYTILPILFTTILYWMTGLTPDAATFFIHLGICVLVAQIAVSLGSSPLPLLSLTGA